MSVARYANRPVYELANFVLQFYYFAFLLSITHIFGLYRRRTLSARVYVIYMYIFIIVGFQLFEPADKQPSIFAGTYFPFYRTKTSLGANMASLKIV